MQHFIQLTIMKRNKLTELQLWKSSSFRKPLIMRGARQVGKTWLLKEFGKTEYKQFVYVNFEDAPNLKTLFIQDFNIERILNTLEIYSGIKIHVKNNQVVVFFSQFGRNLVGIGKRGYSLKFRSQENLQRT